MSANWLPCEPIPEWQTGPIPNAVMLRHREALRADPLAKMTAVFGKPVFGKPVIDRLVGSLSVQRFAGGMSQPFDLVLDHQFSALQLNNLQVVC